MNVTLRHFITNRSTDHFASKTLMTRDEEILYFCICFHTYCMITEELLELTLQSVCPHYVSWDLICSMIYIHIDNKDIQLCWCHHEQSLYVLEEFVPKQSFYHIYHKETWPWHHHVCQYDVCLIWCKRLGFAVYFFSHSMQMYLTSHGLI